MKIYINNIRFENTFGSIIRAEDICQLIRVPKENAIVSDEEMNEIHFGSTFIVNDKDRFFVIRRTVIGS
jgi:hypothetical protein